MNKTLADFTGLYQIQKTLRFSLIPQGKTLENLEKSGLLASDQKRADYYQRTKDIIDKYHKKVLQDSLSGIKKTIASSAPDKFKKARKYLNDTCTDINWELVAKTFQQFQASAKDTEAQKVFEAECKLIRDILINVFQSNEYFGLLIQSTPANFFKLLKATNNCPEDAEAIRQFAQFSTYFVGFQDNRKNIYSSEAQTTAAPYRAIDVNFTKFMANCQIYTYLKEKYNCIILQAQTELAGYLDGKSLDDIFSIANYSDYLPQTGIDFYNNVLGGCVPRDNKKIRGLNEFINLFRQQYPEAKNDRKLANFSVLYKQILSDRESFSFLAKEFDSDEDLIASLKEFHDSIEFYKFNGVETNVIQALRHQLQYLIGDDSIYVSADSLANISKTLFNHWDAIRDAMEEYSEKNYSNKKDREKYLKHDYYTIAELKQLIINIDENPGQQFNPCSYWNDKSTADAANAIAANYEAMKSLFEPQSVPLAEQKDQVMLIKNYLDSMQDFLHMLKPLSVPDSAGKNSAFYAGFDELYAVLENVIPIYNRTRNYLTRKAGELKKIKLMFGTPTLAKGWDQNKEPQNHTVLFEYNGMYYLGIMGKNCQIDFEKLATSPVDSCWHKIIYKLLPGPNKMLPKVFFCSKGKETYNPSRELLEKYEKGLHKKGDDFDINYMRELIDFFKKAINKHPDWSKFNFSFSPTNTYQGIDDFYREVQCQGYKLTKTNIDSKTIFELVESGKLFLFQINNKDYASGKSGKANLHTLYWETLFAPENLADVVFKLNGEAELFWRDAGIKKPFIHKVGEKMVNRITKDGKPLGEKLHGEIFAYANNRLEGTLSNEAKQLLNSGTVVIKDVTHDIIKDRRYTQKQFQFHVPLTINFKTPDTPAKFNVQVLEYLKNNPEVKIIGIDRGERNLIYLTLIDQQGNILEQRSLNQLSRQNYSGQIVKDDYLGKLDKRENERDEARKSWDTIGQIKDLKAGYLSQVVHDITTMMIKHNAIVVMEDLNFGFKRGRFKIEKQVYQNFEHALIDKLNYLVFKDTTSGHPGSVIKGYQLTDKFISFEKLGKQTGFLFYVPAAYTSKIDPQTGFVNIFDLNNCTNAKSRKEFLEKFERIYWHQNHFVFEFDYRNFKTSQTDFRNTWCLSTAGERLVYNPEQHSTDRYSPTDEIVKALQKQDVKLDEGFDLLSYLRNTPADMANASFFKSVFEAFVKTLQMRNSNAATGEDYILSPAIDQNGNSFDSRKTGISMPQDADANGAYHIAMKGLYLLQNQINAGKDKIDPIKNEDWLKFIQGRH